MRIWHEKLIPYLCRQHLLACWREGLGAWSILIGDKQGYRNHPAVKEFRNNTLNLHARLYKIRSEMKKRGYNPKELPEMKSYTNGYFQEWQSLDKQIEVLRSKNCNCDLSVFN